MICRTRHHTARTSSIMCRSQGCLLSGSITARTNSIPASVHPLQCDSDHMILCARPLTALCTFRTINSERSESSGLAWLSKTVAIGAEGALLSRGVGEWDAVAKDC